jgi:predicted GNAT family acetyltransferase
MNLRTYSSPGEFLGAAGRRLLTDEAKNSLILGIAGRVRAGRSYGDEPPYFLGVEDGGDLAAAAIRTPPFPVILYCEEGRLDALVPLVEHLSTFDPELTGVNGESCVAAAFAESWAERTGVRAELERRMRIYALHDVRPPSGVPGRLRPVSDSDEEVDLIAEWMIGFQAEAVPGDPPSDPRASVRRFMETGNLVVWDHGGPVSLAGSSRTTENAATVSAVYTPPEYRGNGYASACVAALCRRLLDGGKAFCTLYADLANPTSNKIYQRIGFRSVSDSAQYRFAVPTSEAE